ncbi:NADH:quinone oxidoreductase [Pseudomonas sp. 15FMM2]|uniref:NADH:quinone oxidoreductase n=1 Tax=Pseudomonas imrae TaxID=2992837 RepID=A0ACC7P6L1_9PSED
MTDMLVPVVSAALISNFVLRMPLASDQLLKRQRVNALGLATLLLMILSGILGYLLHHYLLLPLALPSLRLFMLLAITALLIQPLLSTLSRCAPRLPFDGLWPLLLGNAGVLGAVLLGARHDHDLAYMAVLSLGTGLGFWLALSLFSDLRHRVAGNDIAQPFKGLPLDLIGAGLMTVAFLGFNAMIKS